jgi:hypothetical protein
LSRTF